MIFSCPNNPRSDRGIRLSREPTFEASSSNNWTFLSRAQWAVPRTNEGRAVVFLFIPKSFSDRIHVLTHIFSVFSPTWLLQNERHWRRRSWWCSVRRIRERRIGRQYMLTYMIDVRLDGFLCKRVIDWGEGTIDMRLRHKSSRQFQGQFQHWLCSKFFLH